MTRTILLDFYLDEHPTRAELQGAAIIPSALINKHLIIEEQCSRVVYSFGSSTQGGFLDWDSRLVHCMCIRCPNVHQLMKHQTKVTMLTQLDYWVDFIENGF